MARTDRTASLSWCTSAKSGGIFSSSHSHIDSDRSCLQHPKGSCEAIASILWLWDVGRFGPHRFVRLRAIQDRQAARSSAEKILSWNFDRIIVSHGEVVETDGHNQFAAAFAFLRHGGKADIG